MRLHRHARKRGQRQQDAPLPLIDRCDRLGDQRVGRDTRAPTHRATRPDRERGRRLAGFEAGGLAAPHREFAAAGRSLSSSGRAISRSSSMTASSTGRPFKRQAVHLAAQASLARRDDEPGPRGGIDELFQFLPVQPNVVDQDQRPPVLKRAADLGRGRLADLVALVERVEDLLLQVRGRLLTGGEVDDAVGEGGGRRMICGGSKEGRLADAGVAPDLYGKSAVERREDLGQLRLSAEQAAHRPRPEEYGRRAGMRVDAPRRRRFTHQRAVRPADMQDIPADRHLSGDRAVQRGSPLL